MKEKRLSQRLKAVVIVRVCVCVRAIHAEHRVHAPKTAPISSERYLNNVGNNRVKEYTWSQIMLSVRHKHNHSVVAVLNPSRQGGNKWSPLSHNNAYKV